MDDDGFSTEQLLSLQEFVPTAEESRLLLGYREEDHVLGPVSPHYHFVVVLCMIILLQPCFHHQAEKYMMAMSDFSDAVDRIECMIYKQRFKGEVADCKATLGKIESACDDVRGSERLKKVLKYILRVGNQLNDGETQAGFSLDSLLKLQTAKAFDKKTSILQYVITVIQRQDEDCLRFPLELSHVNDASRLIFDSVVQHAFALRKGLDEACRVITAIRQGDTNHADQSTEKMAIFLYKATQRLDELDISIDKVSNSTQHHSLWHICLSYILVSSR